MATRKKPPRIQQPTPGDLPLPELGAPPSADNPEALANYFVELIDALGQGNAEMKRVRNVLIGCIDSYHANPDPDTARQIFAARMAGVERGVAVLLLGHVKRLRDRLTKDSRKLGTGSREGRAVRTGAEAFSLFADGLQKLLDAGDANDAELRAQAQAAMDQARAKMEELQAATR